MTAKSLTVKSAESNRRLILATWVLSSSPRASSRSTPTRTPEGRRVLVETLYTNTALAA
jgi:hypothetical protein